MAQITKVRSPFPALRSFTVPAIACCLGAQVLAQQNDIPLNREIYFDLDRNHARIDTTGQQAVHTAMRPYIESRANTHHVLGYRVDTTRHFYTLSEKLFKEHLFIVDEDDFHLTIDPVFQFELGQDFRDPSTFADTTRFYHNARGFRVAGDLGGRFSFQTSFYENQAIFPQYLYQYAQTTGVVPGQGRIKGFKNRAFDFAFASGNVSWTPSEWLNIQFGNGKHFVGNGYRSVLLSDNAFNYPYLKFSLQSNNRKWQYTTFHAKLQRLQRLPTGDANESLFYWKRGRFNHLSRDLGRVQIGLFESTIFRNIDSSGVLPFDVLELNSVIGVNTLVNGFNGKYKSLMGLDLKVKLTNKAFVYGQLALDDPATDRQAWQAGIQVFDILGRDLHLLLEYNSIAAYTYQHTPAAMGYTHYEQPLAHPMGSNVDELVVQLDYRFGRAVFHAKANFAEYRLDGPDSLGYNFGGDVRKPFDPITGPEGPLVRSLTYVDLNASWLMNQNTNMRLTLGYWIRDLGNAPEFLNTGYLYVAWQTGLFNRYYDI